MNKIANNIGTEPNKVMMSLCLTSSLTVQFAVPPICFPQHMGQAIAAVSYYFLYLFNYLFFKIKLNYIRNVNVSSAALVRTAATGQLSCYKCQLVCIPSSQLSAQLQLVNSAVSSAALC